MLTFINIKKKYNVQWGALNKPIQEANYKNKKKKIQGNDKSF